MSVDYRKILHFSAAVESTTVAEARRWFHAEDTGRLVITRQDGVTRDYFWNSNSLASTSSTLGTSLLGTIGITGITPQGGTTGGAATLQNMLRGMAQSMILKSPYSSGLNVIQPTVTSAQALILRNITSQATNIFEVQNASSIATAWIDQNGDMTFSRSQSGGLTSFRLFNGSNTAGAGALFLLSVGGSSADGDAVLRYNVNTIKDWAVGVDVSAGQSYKIAGSATLGSSDYFVITSAGAVSIPFTLNVGGLLTLSAGMALTGDLSVTDTRANVPTVLIETTDSPSAINQTGGVLQLGLNTRRAEIRALTLTNFGGGETFTVNPRIGFAFYTTQPGGGPEVMRLTDQGRLMIGTTTDGGQLLQVNGTCAFVGSINAASGIDLAGGGTGATAGRIYTTATSGTIVWGKAGSSTDFLLANSAGANVFTVATGTIDTTFLGSVYISDGKGVRTIISASSRDMIARSGTTLNIGEAGGWTAINYNVVSGSHQFGVGGATRVSIDANGIDTPNRLTFSGFGTTTTAAILRSSQDGLILRGVGGSSNDFAIFNAAGGLILNNPTGTSTLTFSGAPTFSSVSAGQILGVNGSKALVGFSTNGSGSVVLSTSPSLTTPDIGAATGSTLTLSIRLFVNSTVENQVVLNSSGSNFGTISNSAANTWFLGYTTSIGTLGTAALTWNNTGAISVASTFTAASDIILTNTNSFIRSNTADGSDNKSIAIFAANTYDASGGTRSAGILMTGNEYPGGGGAILLFAGQSATAGIFITPPNNLADCFDINDRAGNIYLTIDTLTSAKFVGVPQFFGMGGTLEAAGASHSSGQDAPDTSATPCYLKVRHWNGTSWDKFWLNCVPNKVTP